MDWEREGTYSRLSVLAKRERFVRVECQTI
jgi:hypothetical protein